MTSRDEQPGEAGETSKPDLVDAACSDGAAGPCLIWRFGTPMRAVSSSLLGGGMGEVSWVLNATVDADYGRLDPDHHLAEMAGRLGLHGNGVAMMTAVDVAEVRTASVDGVTVDATVGIGNAVWAALATSCTSQVASASSALRPGTINVVARLTTRLSDAALVNAVVTVTEAKAQALFDRGIDGTGTASDALCVLCPPRGSAESFGGPRSAWGSRLADATYLAVVAGIDGQAVAVERARLPT